MTIIKKLQAARNSFTNQNLSDLTWNSNREKNKPCDIFQKYIPNKKIYPKGITGGYFGK